MHSLLVNHYMQAFQFRSARLEDDVSHQILDNRTQSPSTGATAPGHFCNLLQRLGSKAEITILHAKELAILANQRIPGFRQNPDKIIVIQGLQCRDHRESPDEFRNHAVAQQILHFNMLEQASLFVQVFQV